MQCHPIFSNSMVVSPCHLVPSSCVRLLVIAMIIFLQASRSLAEPHSSASVQFVMALMSSSQRARGLPPFLVPPPIPSIIDFSKLFSLRMICPKYDSCQTRGDSTFNDSDSDSDSSTPFRFRFRLRLQSSWLRFRLRFRLQHYFYERFRFRLRFRLRFNSDSSTPYILIMTPELYKF